MTDEQKKMDLYVWRFLIALMIVFIISLATYATGNGFKRPLVTDSVMIALIGMVSTISVALIVKGVFHNDS